MVDYQSWKRKKINITSLRLDTKNPRLSGFGDKEPSQSQIIEYMIEHENIQSLAKNIANLGFLPNNEPIVFKENGKYIVLEGNRRTTACKILNDPELVSKSNKYRTYKSIASVVNNNLVNHLTVIIASSREAADVLIVNIHTQGSTVEKWDKTKQDRFFYNRQVDGETIETMSDKFNLPKSAIKDSIARHNFFLEFLNLELDAETRELIEDETKFSMTTAERFYKSRRGKEFLGVSINTNGKIQHNLPKLEYQKRLMVITTELLSNKLNSRTYGDDAKQKEYIKSLEDCSEFNYNIPHSKSNQLEYEKSLSSQQINDDSKDGVTEDETKSNKSETSLSTTASANKLIPPKAQAWKSGIPRIDTIFKELKDCNLSTHFNAAAILFRSYLDMVVYQFLQKKGMIEVLRRKEQQKIDIENKKKVDRVLNLLQEKGLDKDLFNNTEIKKIVSFKTGVPEQWIPSLRQMLIFITEDSSIIGDSKLNQALIEYLKGKDEYLGHQDLNLLVHNEYYIKNKSELKKTWDKLYPILDFIQKN